MATPNAPNNEKYDADAIRQQTDLLELASRYVQLKKEGAEYVGLCPFHRDTTRPGNFKVNPQRQVWACFACGAQEQKGADAIGLFMMFENLEYPKEFPEACRRLLNGSGTSRPQIPVAQRELTKPPPRVTCPPPADATPPPLTHRQFGEPSGTWTYRTETGALWGYVCRWDTETGKEYRCITWGQQGVLPAGWERKHFSDSNGLRPIYGLERLAANPNKQILICEGEKAADAADALFPGMVAIAWPGGANAINKVDWSPLKGRKVVLWPDNDEPGIACMGKLAALLQTICTEIKGLRVTDMPAGWDAADWTPDMGDAMTWAKARVFTYDSAIQDSVSYGEIPAHGPDDTPDTPNLPEIPLEAYGDTEGTSQAADTGQAQTTQPAQASQAVEPKKPKKPSAHGPSWKQLGLVLNDKGAALNNLDNAVRALEGDPVLKNSVRYDEFLDAIITDWNGPTRKWKDADDVLLCLYLQRHIGLSRISVNQAHDAAIVAAFHNTQNEIHDYLNGLQWDGIERLPFMLSDGFGADNNAYTQAVGRCWMVSMAARALNPGCKVDTVPVLEGPQGKQKSSALAVIGGKWFVECHENVMSKDFYGVLTGHILVEISEMHTFSRAEIERVKGIISCQVDRYRKAYGRHTEDHPRHTVLVGTTNRDDYHKDETGGRRFWPVLCREISLDYLRENRDQLWAEAVHRYRLAPAHATAEQRIAAGAAWWDIPEADQQQEIAARRDVDSWETAIEEWLLSTARQSVTVTDVLKDCLEIEVREHDQMRQKRVGRVLRALGWVSKVRRDPDGKNRKVWMIAD